jgi:hypothetical protein
LDREQRQRGKSDHWFPLLRGSFGRVPAGGCRRGAEVLEAIGAKAEVAD